MNKLLYYGVANACGIVLMLIFLFISFKYFANKEYRKQLIPIKFMFIFLIVMEIAKIYAHIWINGSWNPKSMPIIYCSLVMYLYPIICYAKRGSVWQRIALATSVISFTAIGVPYLFSFPNINFDNVSTYSFIMNTHSRVYHFLMLGVAIYIIFSKLYDFRFRDFIPVALFNSAYFVFCTFLSIFIGGEISNFGPKSKELSFFYEKTGYAIGNLFLVLAVPIVAFLIFGIIDLIKRAANKNLSKQSN